MEAVGIALQKRSFFNVTREESVGVTKEELVYQIATKEKLV